MPEIEIGVDPGKGKSGVFAYGIEGEAYAWTFRMKGLTRGLTIEESLEIVLKRIDYHSDWPVLVAYELPYKGQTESRGHIFGPCTESRHLAYGWIGACKALLGSKVRFEKVRPGDRHLINCRGLLFESDHIEDAYRILQCALNPPKGPLLRKREQNAWRHVRRGFVVEKRPEKHPQPRYINPCEDWRE